MNNKLLNITLKLTVICAIAALILGVVNMITEPVIIQQKIIAQQEALIVLSDGDDVGEQISPVSEGESDIVHLIYPIEKNGETIKYILQLTGSGYGGEMVLLAVFAVDGSFVKAKLMENNETPGLGKKAEEDSYYAKFDGFGGADSAIPVNKNELTDVYAEAVSGSTITFSGISAALAYGSDYVKSMGGKN